MAAQVKDVFGHADYCERFKGVFGRRPFCGPLRRGHKMWAGQKFPGVGLRERRQYGMRRSAFRAVEALAPGEPPGANDAELSQNMTTRY